MIPDQVRRLMGEVFNVDRDSIADDASPETIEGWDSMQHLNLVLALEGEFAVRLSADEISDITSFAKIVAALERRSVSV